jgi:hypothetical protein
MQMSTFVTLCASGGLCKQDTEVSDSIKEINFSDYFSGYVLLIDPGSWGWFLDIKHFQKIKIKLTTYDISTPPDLILSSYCSV